MPNRDDALGILIMHLRQALLMAVDAIEVYFNLKRTSELRREEKDKDWPGTQGHV